MEETFCYKLKMQELKDCKEKLHKYLMLGRKLDAKIYEDKVCKLDQELKKYCRSIGTTSTHYITTEEIDERIYLNDYPEEI